MEPEFYVPILPMILMNGSEGIGTGFSMNLPSYNPLEIATNFENRIRGSRPFARMIPWFKGFKGKVIDLGDGKFLTKGLYRFTL